MSEDLNANDARNIVASINNKKSNNEWTEIQKEIRKAAEKGFHNCYYYHTINETTKQRLLNNGFTVNVNMSDQRQGEQVSIYW